MFLNNRFERFIGKINSGFGSDSPGGSSGGQANDGGAGSGGMNDAGGGGRMGGGGGNQGSDWGGINSEIESNSAGWGTGAESGKDSYNVTTAPITDPKTGKEVTKENMFDAQNKITSKLINAENTTMGEKALGFIIDGLWGSVVGPAVSTVTNLGSRMLTGKSLGGNISDYAVGKIDSRPQVSSNDWAGMNDEIDRTSQFGTGEYYADKSNGGRQGILASNVTPVYEPQTVVPIPEESPGLLSRNSPYIKKMSGGKQYV